MLRWIPNLISLARIALVPLVIASIATERLQLGLGLFVVAGFSDGLDGWLARRFAWRTELGAILDPIADKLLLMGTFVVMAVVGVSPWWLALLVVLRDLIIMSGAITYHFLYGDLEGKPTLVGKLNTVLLLLYVVVALGHAAFADHFPVGVTEMALQGVTIALLGTMAISTLGYMQEWMRRAQLRSSA